MCKELLTVLVVAALAVCAVAETQKQEGLGERIAGAKDICRNYVDIFCSDKTQLVYSGRINTPKGLARVESPEEVANEHVRGKYKPYGYGAGFEDVAYHNGTFLFALSDAYDATQEPYFAELAHRIFSGMKRIGTLSPVAGFVPRGPHPVDGKSYYRDSSLDQHTLYVAGLWRYYRSKIANDEEKAFIRDSLDKVATRMEKNKWVMLVEDNSRRAHAGGGDWHHSDHLLLFTLAAVKDVTGTPHWQAEYDKYSNDKDGDRWRRMAGPLRKKLPRYTLFSNQEAFRMNVLSRVEEDPVRKRIPADRQRRRAADMFTCNFITHWRPLDWLARKPTDEDYDVFFKPVGYTHESKMTIFDLWQEHKPGRRPVTLSDGRKRYHHPVTNRLPVMVWQIALLSGDPDLARQVSVRITELHRRMRPDRGWGWDWNYATVVVLLDLAHCASEKGDD